MAYKKVGLDFLSRFIPKGAYTWIQPYLRQYRIDLRITPDRKTRLGDYMFHPDEERHKISVNGSLNTYEFFFTFIHELAHLITFTRYRHSVDPHGREWKAIFSQLMQETLHFFPDDLKQAIERHFNSLKSAQCYDAHLYLSFKKYDAEEKLYVSQLTAGATFTTHKGEQYKVLEKKRTRYVCENTRTGKRYLFPALYEIRSVEA